MKTTLNISEKVMRELKQEAARTGKTMSELVEEALRAALAKQKKTFTEIVLPTFRGGKPRIDISNREMLYEVMDGR
jgi:hypothetical protein